MRNIEDLAAEEEERIQIIFQERFRKILLVLAWGSGLWGWFAFYKGEMTAGALAIVVSLGLFSLGWGMIKVFHSSLPSFLMGCIAAIFALVLYWTTRLPTFYWGNDPAFWLSVHGGAVVEPVWSPLSYLLAQAADFVFPARQFSLLPGLSGLVMAFAFFFIMQDFFIQFKNKTLLNAGLGLLVCGVLGFSRPFWNAGTLGMGLISSLGFLLFLFQRSLLRLDDRPWKALYFLLALLGCVHPLWGLLGLVCHWGSLDVEGKGFKKYSFPVLLGLTPYLWIVFRTNHFFPSWGGNHPFLELFKNLKFMGLPDLEDGSFMESVQSLGWITALLGGLTVLLALLNFLFWSSGNKSLLSALDFWTWFFSGAAALLFFSSSSELLAPVVLWFVMGLASFLLRILEKGINKKAPIFFSGSRLAGLAAGAMVLSLGLIWIPGQSYARRTFYFPQQHALNLLHSLNKNNLLICDEPFEFNACLESRLMEPAVAASFVLRKTYLDKKWYIAQCIERNPELLFSDITGSPDMVLKSLILNNRDHWTLQWSRTTLPAGWTEPKAFPTVLTQMFEGQTGIPADPESFQYRYDLTALPQFRLGIDPQSNQYLFRYIQGFNELGKSLMSEGRYSSAIHAFERAAKIDPSYSEPQTYLSKMYSQQNILEAAQLEFEKTIKANPEKINELMKALELAKKEKNDAQTMMLLDQMIQLNSELADAQYQLSKIYDKQGRSLEAKALLESSVQLNPKQIEAQMSLGRVMAQMGNRIGAEEAFRAVLEINPENKEAQMEIWKLLNKS